MAEERMDGEETTDASDDNERNTSADDESTDTSSTSTSTDDESQKSQENDASDDEILSQEERQRRDELLGTGADKELLDQRSQFGRIEKEYKEKIAELNGVVNALKVNTTDGGMNSASTQTDDPEQINYHTPSAPFQNEDGSLNEDALAEWNLLSNQKLYAKQMEIEKKIESLGGSVTSFEETEAKSKAYQEFNKRYGLSREQYENYDRIKSERGDFDAMEYLDIERKERKAMEAAQAHREQQRIPSSSLLTSGNAAPTVSQDQEAAAQIAKDILAIPRGEKRNEAIQAVPFTYPGEVSSRILALVVDGS